MGAWQKCGDCGAVIADIDVHEKWHGEQVTDGERTEAENPVGE